MRLKTEHAKDVMSLECFQAEKKSVWHEETMEQAECMRWTGHDDRPLEELIDGRWHLIQRKDVCIHCGARRL